MLLIIRTPTKLVRSLPFAVSLFIVIVGHLVTEPIQSPVPIDSIVLQALKASNGDINWHPCRSTRGYVFRMAIRREDSWSDPRTVSFRDRQAGFLHRAGEAANDRGFP